MRYQNTFAIKITRHFQSKSQDMIIRNFDNINQLRNSVYIPETGDKVLIGADVFILDALDNYSLDDGVNVIVQITINQGPNRWKKISSSSSIDTGTSIINGTAAYDPLNPIAGWSQPTVPAGSVSIVAFTDGTIVYFTYDGTTWTPAIVNPPGQVTTQTTIIVPSTTLANAGSQTYNFNVIGVVVGGNNNIVPATSLPSPDFDTIDIEAFVTANDTVTVTITNDGGDNIIVPSFNLHVFINP